MKNYQNRIDKIIEYMDSIATTLHRTNQHNMKKVVTDSIFELRLMKEEMTKDKTANPRTETNAVSASEASIY